jgi:hypothetical protein
MSIWFFVLLILVLASILGPLSLLRPSPAQRRKEVLRQLAHQSGFRFALRRLPKQATDMEEPAALPVYYLPPDPKVNAENDWMLLRTSYAHDANFYQEWAWQADKEASAEVMDILKKYLPSLPNSVKAISQGTLGTCVYWSEQEDEKMLQHLLTLLREINIQ